MNALGKTLHFDRAALRAFLAGLSRIDRNGSLASVFCFVSEKEQEQAPSGIRYGLGEHSAGQALDVQLLESDQVETFDQLPRFSMGEVLALCSNAFMDASNAVESLAAIPASLLTATEPALGAFQLPFGETQKARIGDLGSIGECGE